MEVSTGYSADLHNQSDHKDTEHVEENYSPECHLHGIRNELPRVFGLRAGQCHDLDVAEGIRCRYQGTPKPQEFAGVSRNNVFVEWTGINPISESNPVFIGSSSKVDNNTSNY